MNIEEITSKIANQIALAVAELGYTDLDFEVCTERMFVEKEDHDPNRIYFVCKYGKGTRNYAITDIPNAIECLSEEGSMNRFLDVVYKFIANVNYQLLDGIIESYLTPQVTDGFSEVYTGYRSLVFLHGNIRIPNDNITVGMVEEIKFDGQSTAEPFLTCTLGYETQPDPVSFPSNGGATLNVNRQYTQTISFTGYLTNSAFCTKCLGVFLGDGETGKTAMNATVAVVLKVAGKTFVTRNYTITSVTIPQTIGNYPQISVVLTRS